ncbi:MAG: hypothetical protein GX638_02080 [Crenarchaeota archaeon]|nr:hypothetical protein [Thermoproteota archaeon]
MTTIIAVQQSIETFNQSYTLESEQQSDFVGISGVIYTQNPFLLKRVYEGKIVVEGKNVELEVLNRDRIEKTFNIGGKNVTALVGSNDPKDIHELINTAINDVYIFNLPASGQFNYEFILQNTGDQEANINFQIKETNTNYGIFIFGALMTLFITFPGTILIISERKNRKALFQTTLQK